MVPLSGSAAVPRVSRVTGCLRVPGDKSISHRYAMLAAIADGVSRLHGYAPGADCAATLACLAALGVRIERGPVLTIHGLGAGGLKAPAGPLDAANSGTSMRLLAGLLAAHPFRSVLGGDASLSRRPMKRVIEPLTRMGAGISAVDGHPPLTIDGTHLKAIAYTPEVPSAQVKSAVLLAGLHADGRTTVTEPAPTRDHTERAFAAFGARVIIKIGQDGTSVSVDGGQRLRAIEADVPGDISSAVFWMALAAGTPGSDLTIEGVGLNPSRTGVLEVFRRAGAVIEVIPPEAVLPPKGGNSTASHLEPASLLDSCSFRLQAEESLGEPIGSIRVQFGQPRSFEIAPHEVPGLIDEIPGLAALAAMQPGIAMTVRGAQELRVKESDRITMLARGFHAIGIRVEEYPDGFTIHGGPPSAGQPDAAHDHRLAMAFAIASSRGDGPVEIAGADAVAVSYPGFFEELARVAHGQ